MAIIEQIKGKIQESLDQVTTLPELKSFVKALAATKWKATILDAVDREIADRQNRIQQNQQAIQDLEDLKTQIQNL